MLDPSMVEVPFWVIFDEFSLEYHSWDTIHALVETIGTVHRDTPLEGRTRRVEGYNSRIIMNVKRLLPKGVVLETEKGKKLFIPFIYEHLLSAFCINCVNKDQVTDLCPFDNHIDEDMDLMVTQQLNPNERGQQDGPNNTMVSPYASCNPRQEALLTNFMAQASQNPLEANPCLNSSQAIREDNAGCDHNVLCSPNTTEQEQAKLGRNPTRNGL